MNWLMRLLLAAGLVAALSVEAAGSRLQLPFRCTDADSNPLSGCRAYSYESGTSTPLALYSDEARTSSHGDYVESDSSGYFPDSYGDPADCYKIKYTKSDGTTVIATQDNLCPPPDASNTSEALSALGISGTAATENVGTSGNALCLLNTGCTYSALQTFNSDIEVNSTSDAATAAPAITLSRDAANPAVGDVIGEVVFQGKDSGTGDVDYCVIDTLITDETDTTEDGGLQIKCIIDGSETTVLAAGAFDSTDDSVLGANLPSGHTYYVDGFPAPGTPIAVLEDQKTSGTNAGTCTSGADETRDLNTEVYDPFSLVSISSNQFTLQPGTYTIEWSAPANRVNSHQSLLYDITGAAEVKRGTSEESDQQTDSESEGLHVQTSSVGEARVTIASANTYEIRHRCETTISNTGLGQPASFGTEVYTRVKITSGWWLFFFVLPAPCARRRRA